MKSQSSLPIQYGTGLRPDVAHGFEKTTENAGVQSQQQSFRTSFPSQLNESIIDVYERSKENAAVPDERTGIDRRRSSTRRQSSQESASIQAGKVVANINMSFADQKTNKPHSKAEDTPPPIFSPSREKGNLVDIWA